MPSLSELGFDALGVLNESPALTYVVAITDEPSIVFASESVRHVLGYAPSQFTDQPGFLPSIVHPDDVPSLRETFQAALTYGAATRDRRMKLASGEWRWFRDHFRVVYGADGRVSHGIGSIFDVNGEKAALRTLESRRSEYSVLAEHSSDLISRVTVDGKFLYQSPSAKRLMGFEPGARQGQSVLGQIHPDDHAAIEQAWRAAMKTRTAQRYAYRAFHAEGRWVTLEAMMNPVVDPDTCQVIEFVVVSRDITERVETERRLQEARKTIEEQSEIYGLFARHGSDFFVRLSLDGFVTHVSPSHERIIGRQHQMAAGQQLCNVIHADDLPCAMAAWKEALETLTPRIFRARIQHGDGRLIWLETEITPILNAARDRADEMIALSRDVTHQISVDAALAEAQDRIREQSELYDLFATQGADIFLRFKVDGTVTHVSPSHERVLGKGTLVRNGRVAHMVHPDDLDDARAAFRSAHDTKTTKTYRQRYRHADGHFIWIEVTLTPLLAPDSGDVIEYIAIARDIDAQVKHEAQLAAARQALDESRARLRLVADNIGDVVTLVRPDGSVAYMSPSVQKVIGYSKSEMAVGDRISLVHADDRPSLDAEYEKNRRGEVTPLLRYRVQHKDGRMIWVERRATPVTEHDFGDGIAVISIARDISDDIRHREEMAAASTQLERAKIAAEAANVAKSQFLATMSHELRTPMTGVMGMLDLIKGSDLSDEQARYAHIAYESAENLLAILNDILDFSKIEAGQLSIEQVPLHLRAEVEKVSSLLTPVAQKRGNTLAVRIEDMVPDAIVGDAMRLRQILFNLVGNAIKFTEGGLISLDVALTPAGRLRFTVRDNGLGIPAAMRERLFSPFVQADGSASRKVGGTGLGLAISKSLVEAMKGEIAFDSEEGKGSTFWFEMPWVGHEAEIAPVTATLTQRPSQRRTFDILVAEDHPVNQQLIAALLRRERHRVTIAANGRLAVDAVQAQRFDLVLMDIQMPVLDGVGATREIRALASPAATIPIVAITANALRGDMEAYLAAGMTGYVSKPIRIEALRDAIEQAVPFTEADRLAG